MVPAPVSEILRAMWRSKAFAAAPLTLLLVLGSLGCGGSPGVPLLGGTVTGSYQDSRFTAAYGLAFDAAPDRKFIMLGDDPINCESPTDDEPPSGHVGALSLSSLEVGTYGDVFVNLLRNIDGFTGRGSNQGMVEITASSVTEVAGTVSYDFTDDEGLRYQLSGDFRVTRCAERPD